jgi:CHAD domain-containing protein
MASRFRWRIIEHYLNQIPRWRTDRAKAEGCQQLLQAMVNVEKIAAYQRFITPDLLQDAFGSAAERRQVDVLLTQWGKIRQELEQVLQQHNLDEITRLLEQSKELNGAFMVLVSKRYHELLLEMNGDEDDQEAALMHAVAS